MVARGDDTVVLWPRYFDRSVSRAAGRRVTKDLAVKRPDAAWVNSAAKKAGYKPDLQAKARHPAIPWKVVGRVLISAKGEKEEVIRKVAEAMAATAQ
jgi:signal recognition particle subunit SEC65